MSLRSILGAVLLMLGAALAGGQARAATTYTDCYWDGTPPFCAGRCRPGYVVRNQKFCFNGSRVYCCRRAAPCTPARYGQPDCPYPGFGTSRPSPPSCPGGTTGTPPNCRKIPGGGCGPGLKGTPPDCYLDVR